MKYQVRGRRSALIFSLIALTFLLTSCGSGLPAVSWFGVSAIDGVAYLAANEQVFALDLESGAELWAFPTEPNKETGPFFGTPLVKRESIVGGSYGDGKLYGISRDRGMQEWVVETGAGIVDRAISTNGGVIVGNNAGEVYLVESETQDKRLLMKADEAIWAAPLVDEANERVYVASMDHHLYALDLARGEPIWTFDAGGALASTPALSDGVLFFGTITSKFYALDADTADELWQIETDGWVWGSPLIHEGTVYFGDLHGDVRALDAADGSRRWTFEADSGVRVTPVLADDLIFFGTREGRVYALTAENGTQEWSLPLTGAIFSQPTLSGRYLLIAPHNAKVQLVALDPESGAERWSYPPREE